MAKNTVRFSIIDFFGFRLAIPFENPLSLCAAVTHAILYPQRTQADELGTRSIQVLLHAPGEFLDSVHAGPQQLDALLARQINPNPWSFPLSLSAPPFTPVHTSIVVPHHLPTLFSLEEMDTPGSQREEADGSMAEASETGYPTPYLGQLHRIFSPDNQRELQLSFLRWLKEILVLYEQKIGTTLTYIYYPYHPYLLKQVKRFGPLGFFFAQQGAYDPEQFQRTRQALLNLVMASSSHADYIEGIVRPLLLHEYAVELASIGLKEREAFIVVVPYALGSLEFAIYSSGYAHASSYLGTWEAVDGKMDAKTIATEVAQSCFSLREQDTLTIAVFTPGETAVRDCIQYFHCSTTGIRNIKTTLPLAAPFPKGESYQLGLESAAPGLSHERPVIRAPMIQMAMQDIERIARLSRLDRFDRLRWIDRLLNFHLVLYVLHRGVRNCNCCKARSHRDDPSTCARLFAVVDCTREFRSEVAKLCFADFTYLRDGIRKNYSQYVSDRLSTIEISSPLPPRNAAQSDVEKYWEDILYLPKRGKTFKKFWSILSAATRSAALDEERTQRQVWTEALVHYFSSSDGDLARIFETINTHGHMIAFIEPTTGSNRRRKLTMSPELLETLIHCIAVPGEHFISLNDVMNRLFERYGLIVNVGDPSWQQQFEHAQDKQRIEGWISTIGEQNVDALRNILREAGLLLEYSDSNAVVKVHYGTGHTDAAESEGDE